MVKLALAATPSSEGFWPVRWTAGVLALALHGVLVAAGMFTWQSAPLPGPVLSALNVQMVTVPVAAPVPQPAQIMPAALETPKPPPKEAELAFEKTKPKVSKQTAAPKPMVKPRQQPLPKPTQPVLAEPIEDKPVATETPSASPPGAAESGGANKGKSQADYHPISKQAPSYPRAALRKKLEGNCTVEYVVNAKGLVEAPKVIGDCHPLFVSPSLQAAKNFRYEPKRIGGIAVPVANVKNTFEYRIR